MTRLSESDAARVMLGLNLCFVLAALLLSTRAMLVRLRGEAELGNVLFAAMIAAIIVSIPIHNELRGLETNSIVLLSFALALYWMDRRPMLAGAALAVAINIKYLPIIAVPYFLLRRRYTAAIATLAASVAIALLPVLSLGWSTNLRYLHEAVSGLGHLTGNEPDAGAKVNGAGDLSSLSITSTIARLGAPSHWSKPVQLGIVGLIAAVWGGSILLAYRESSLPDFNWPADINQRTAPFHGLLAVEWAALLTFALAFSPNTQNRNLVLAIIPATLAAALICSPLRSAWRAAVAFVTTLMLIGLTLPIAMMGKTFTVAWLATGGPCWVLLITFIVLGWAGVLAAVNDGRSSDSV